MTKVSVIIPVFRVASFVERCTRSLMRQTLSDVEFIFVDDASPDESMDIVRMVCDEYSRDVKILVHPENKGLPAARNTGLAMATGEYIYHCDSDDWLETDMLEKMYSAAKDADADIAYCDFFLSFETGERYMSNPEFHSGEDLLKDGFLAGTTKYNVWNKIVKRSLYETAGVLFPSGHSMGEDMTMILLSAKAGKVAYVDKALYHYVKLNMNAFSNTFSQRHLDDIEFNSGRVFECLEKENIPEEYISFFKLNLKLPFLLSGDKSQYRLWKEWFPEADKYAMSNKFLPLRTRLVQWFASKGLFFMVDLYGFLVNKIYYGLRYRA